MRGLVLAKYEMLVPWETPMLSGSKEEKKRGGVVRLKKRYGEAFPESRRIVMRYYSAETFGPGLC